MALCRDCGGNRNDDTHAVACLEYKLDRADQAATILRGALVAVRVFTTAPDGADAALDTIRSMATSALDIAGRIRRWEA